MAIPNPKLDLESLKNEVEQECQRYGTVTRIIAREETDLLRFPWLSEVERVRVFVQFSTVEESERARSAIDARDFDGRVVDAVFYPDQRFQLNDLEPDEANEPQVDWEKIYREDRGDYIEDERPRFEDK